MAKGVPGSKAEHVGNLLQKIVLDNLRKCRATILAAADFQNILKPQD